MKSISAATAPRLRLWREASDTHIRSRFGGYYYLLAWAMLWLTSSNPEQNLWIWSGGGLLLLVFFVLRSRQPPAEHLQPVQLQRWLDRRWTLLLLQSLTWGLMLAGIQLYPGIIASHLVTVLCVVVFGTALVLYLGYLGLLLYRWNREYRIGVERELRLLHQGEQLDRLSRTDALTGLNNRYQFNALLPNWLASARRQNSTLALVLLDIDFFKKINDQFGHRAGDLYLQAFAERMRQVFRRDSDILLRLGGEEFAVLMSDTSLEQAKALA